MWRKQLGTIFSAQLKVQKSQMGAKMSNLPPINPSALCAWNSEHLLLTTGQFSNQEK